MKVSFPVRGNGQVDTEAAAGIFHDAHERHFTYRLDNKVQIVNSHLTAIVVVDKPEPARREITGRRLDDIVLHRRKVDLDRYGIHATIVYDGVHMEPGMELIGPAVIQEPATTLVVSPDHRVTMDKLGNYHIEIATTENK